METELPYLVKTQICLAAFWIAYRLLFARDKAFARNRAYLLLTVAAAFVIPALSVPQPEETRTVSAFRPRSSPEYNPKRSPAPDRAVFRRDSDCFATQAI